MSVNISIRKAREYVDKKLKELIPPDTPKLELFHSLPSVTLGFTNRKELEDIDKYMHSGSRIVVITGPGGIGKTEIAKKYAELHAKEFDKICFAYYTDSIQNTIVNGLRWSKGPWDNRSFDEQLWLKIEYLKSQKGRMLLILDDVKEIESYKYINDLLQHNIRILITTRHQQLGDYCPLPVKALEFDDLLHLFAFHSKSSRAWMEEKKLVLREIIINILQSHTMLTVLTAKLYHTADYSIEEFRDLLKSDRLVQAATEKIKNFKDSDRENAGSNTVDDVLCGHVLKLFSIADLSKDSNKIDVLRNLSILPYSGIERKLFVKWMELENKDVINRLIDEGWITLSVESEIKRISMHAVISDAVYIQTKPDAESCKEVLSSILKESSCDSYTNPAHRL